MCLDNDPLWDIFWDPNPPADSWHVLGQLPSLTHLALPLSPGQSGRSDLLACCTSLWLLLIREPAYVPWSRPRPTPPLSEDPRLVFFEFPLAYDGGGNWRRDAFAEFSDDLWARADRTGVVDSLFSPVEQNILPAELNV
ncbi:hypothetical protein C8F01DRAFT_1083145 [Mycena amicta]|nr:hypothetical protein C8F01DRAFT_1083145 [Mycena amicta]